MLYSLCRSGPIGWLQVAAFGAIEGIVSTASLVEGMATAGSGNREMLVVGILGTIAGATAIAFSEYASVCSTDDTERAELEREWKESALDALQTKRDSDLGGAKIDELTMIDEDATPRFTGEFGYADPRCGQTVADEYARRPFRTAAAFAMIFALGGAVPLLALLAAPYADLTFSVATVSLVSVTALGGCDAVGGGANVIKSAGRVAFCATIALAIAASAGALCKALN